MAKASHAHNIYRNYNSKVYYWLEEVTRAKSYAASIIPFKKVKYGREPWSYLKAQYDGVGRWEA